MANSEETARHRAIIELVSSLAADAPRDFLPPSEGSRPSSEHVLAFSHVRKTRGYLERVVNQINGCYERGWFDGCAVMMRRMVETLIIECYEAERIADQIKNPAGEFYMLKDLINKILAQPQFNIGRGAKQGLGKLKEIGDYSAHSRRYNAHREDIDKVTSDFRLAARTHIPRQAQVARRRHRVSPGDRGTSSDETSTRSTGGWSVSWLCDHRTNTIPGENPSTFPTRPRAPSARSLTASSNSNFPSLIGKISIHNC